MIGSEWRGAEFSARATTALVEGLNNAAIYGMAKMVEDEPIDTGAMRASTQVSPATEGDLESDVTVNTSYAVYVHEEVNNHHPVGEAKFAERTWDREHDKLVELIGAPLGRIT